MNKVIVSLGRLLWNIMFGFALGIVMTFIIDRIFNLFER